MKKIFHYSTMLFILGFIYGCATFDAPSIGPKNPDKSLSQGKDSIAVAFQFMTPAETNEFCKTYFIKPVRPAFISIENNSKSTLRYMGEGLWNHEIDENISHSYTQNSVYLEVGAGLLATLSIAAKRISEGIPSIAQFVPLLINTGFLMYNEIIENRIARYYKDLNLKNYINWEIKPGQQKQFILLFDEKSELPIEIYFAKSDTKDTVKFQFNR